MILHKAPHQRPPIISITKSVPKRFSATNCDKNTHYSLNFKSKSDILALRT